MAIAEIVTPKERKPSEANAIVAWAKSEVDKLGIDREIIAKRNFEFNESDLMRELAWVILCSGFREKIIRSRFGKISLCFCDWSSCAEISANAELCVATALDVFRSRAKLQAIAHAAREISSQGFEVVKSEIVRDPIPALQRFPFIGKVTAYHLAKNLGFEVAKPDRHLVRLASRHGYSDVQEFCARLSEATGESVRDIDTILWRISEMGLAEELFIQSICIHSASEEPTHKRALPFARVSLEHGLAWRQLRDWLATKLSRVSRAGV